MPTGETPRSNLIRIARILGCFDHRNSPRPTHEILSEVGMGRSTGFGLLRALTLRGWLEKVDHGLLRLGPRAGGLAFVPLEAVDTTRPGSTAALPLDRSSADPHHAITEWDTRLFETVSTDAYKRPAPFRIGFANASLSNEWRRAMFESMRYAKRLHADRIDAFLVREAADDAGTQVNQIDELVKSGIDLLLVSTTNAHSPHLDRKLKEVADAGLPVVAVDRRPRDPSSLVSFVTASDRRIGRISALWLAERLKGVGRIWMLSGLEGASPAMRRQSAAFSGFSEFPGIQIEAVTYTDWTEEGGRKAIQRLFDQGGDAPDGIWCDSGLQGVGSLKFFVENELAVPAHTGGDLNQMYKLALYHKVPFVALDYPAAMGARVVEVALDILSGKSVPRRVEVPVPIVLPRGMETASVRADTWAERHVGWDLPGSAILSQGPSLRGLRSDSENKQGSRHG
ncbi:MAG: substrate-binding domain-containing protein [Pseudomonadota bacterium]